MTSIPLLPRPAPKEPIIIIHETESGKEFSDVVIDLTTVFRTWEVTKGFSLRDAQTWARMNKITIRGIYRYWHRSVYMALDRRGWKLEAAFMGRRSR